MDLQLSNEYCAAFTSYCEELDKNETKLREKEARELYACTDKKAYTKKRDEDRLNREIEYEGLRRAKRTELNRIFDERVEQKMSGKALKTVDAPKTVGAPETEWQKPTSANDSMDRRHLRELSDAQMCKSIELLLGSVGQYDMHLAIRLEDYLNNKHVDDYWIGRLQSYFTNFRSDRHALAEILGTYDDRLL